MNFEGESVAELTNPFHEAVDDYLAYCAEEGIKPHKSYSSSLNVRLTPGMFGRLMHYMFDNYSQILVLLNIPLHKAHGYGGVNL